MIVFGRPFEHFGRRIHRYAATWPARWVVDGRVLDSGWNHCALCGKGHRLWVTDDAEWKRLPRRLRKLRLCVGCFREHAR